MSESLQLYALFDTLGYNDSKYELDKVKWYEWRYTELHCFYECHFVPVL